MKKMLNASDAALPHLSAPCKYGDFHGVVYQRVEVGWVCGRFLSAFSFHFLHCTALFICCCCFFFPWVVTSGYTIMLSVL